MSTMLSGPPSSTGVDRLAVLAAVAVLVAVSGCLGAPAGQGGPVSLQLANDDNTTHELSVIVVSGELGDNSVGIDRVGRDVIRVSPKQGLVTYTFTRAQPDVESIDIPQNRTVSREEFQLAPNESARIDVTEFQTGDTLVVVDRRDGRITTLITANCADEDLDFVSITAGPARTAAGYACS